jgi:hypothetical protein
MGDSLSGGGAAQAGGAEEKLVVAIRPRPLQPGETPDAGLRLTHSAVELKGGDALLFDRVYSPEADNGAVYDDVAAPVVAAVLLGISGAIVAYGQTGSGKTRTMRGAPDELGLVPRAVRASRARKQRRQHVLSCVPEQHAPRRRLGRLSPPRADTTCPCDAQVRAIFEHVEAQAGVRDFKVSLSYLELYNETLRDLLCPVAKLDVMERKAGVYVHGAQPTEVSDLSAALCLLEKGDTTCTTAATAMNAQSSRSHCIVRIIVESKEANGALESICVDCAPCERPLTQ